MSSTVYLNSCNPQNTPPDSANVQNPVPFCGKENPYAALKDPSSLSQRDVPLVENIQHLSLGESGNCDPSCSGQLFDEINNPETNRNVIHRYSRALRGADDAMLDLFKNIYVQDDNNTIHGVPIVHAAPQKAVAFILQENVRKDVTNVVDRIKLPILSLWTTGIEYARKRYVYHKAIDRYQRLRSDGKPGLTIQEKRPRDTILGTPWGIPIDISYTLSVWCLYIEDLNQIIESVLLKVCSPMAYLRIQGVQYEVPVVLTGQTSNIENEPGDKATRVIKYNFTFRVETYIPQPISREKSVLSVITKTFNGNDVTSNIIDTNIESVTDQCP